MDICLPKKVIGKITLILILLHISGVAFSGELDLGVSTSVSYSDNIHKNDENKESDLFTTIRPFLKYKLERDRFTADVDYSLLSSVYDSAEYKETIYHRLDANLQAEFIKDELFFKLNMDNTQSVIDPDGIVSFGEFRDDDNTANVFSILAEPYWQKRLASNLELRVYSWFAFDIFDPGSDDFERRGVSVSLGSRNNIERLIWRITASHDRTHTRNYLSSALQKGLLYVSYPVVNRIILFAEGGVERERYRLPPDAPWDEEDLWKTGVNWFPSKRTFLSLSAGHQVFGDVFAFNLNHTRRSFSFSTSYSEALTSVTGLVINDDANVYNFNGDISSLFRIEEDRFIQKILEVDTSYNGLKSIFSLKFNRDVREYRLQNTYEKLFGVDLSCKYNFSKKSMLSVSGKWQRLGQTFDERVDDVSLLSTRFDRRFGKGSKYFFEVNQQIRDGKQITNEFKETVATIGVELLY